VNDYLRERMGDEFTAKDFRTWHATLHALTLLDKVPVPEKPSERALRRCINAVIKDVAAGLRNTPAVCRKSYINPAVFIAWQNSELRRRAARGGPAKALLAVLGRAGH
jgi:DNA topoisomerase IB